jgi:2,3-bisphosphoglycerate-dependent phosphoglycerate mutase
MSLIDHLTESGIMDLGTTDRETPLTAQGVWQAQTTGQSLSRVREVPDLVVVSPYLRTQQTYEAICAGWLALSDVEKVDDERVRELEHGPAADKHNDWRVFNTLNPIEKDLRKTEGSYLYRCPGGENVPDVRERVRSMYKDLIMSHAGKRILIVSHHIAKLSMIAELTGLDGGQYKVLDRTDKPKNCSVTDLVPATTTPMTLSSYNVVHY